MLRGLTLRRVASGLFVIALIALLVVPVVSVARVPQAQAAVGSAHSKATTSATRSPQTTSHFNPTDRFQIDPSTPPDVVDEPSSAVTGAIDQVLTSTAEVEASDPTVRGPPAL